MNGATLSVRYRRASRLLIRCSKRSLLQDRMGASHVQVRWSSLKTDCVIDYLGLSTATVAGGLSAHGEVILMPPR